MGGALMVVSRTRREAGRGVGAGDPVTPLPLRPGSLGWGGAGGGRGGGSVLQEHLVQDVAGPLEG